MTLKTTFSQRCFKRRTGFLMRLSDPCYRILVQNRVRVLQKLFVRVFDVIRDPRL